MASALQVQNSKTFPGARDRNEYLRHPDIVQMAIESLPADQQKQFLDPLDQIPDFADRLKHRTRSGFNDPMSVFLVIDAMLSAFPGSYLRSMYLSLWLNRNRPDFIWEPITVGRIMGEIVDVAAETFEGMERFPVDRGTDWRGHYIVIDPDGGYTGRLWLYKLRQRLIEKCQALLDAEFDGEVPARSDSVWFDVDTSR